MSVLYFISTKEGSGKFWIKLATEIAVKAEDRSRIILLLTYELHVYINDGYDLNFI